MDFNKIKNFDWENLKRADLGASYKNIFNEMYLILFHLKEIILGFETTYPGFLSIDQDKLKAIYNTFFNFLNETQNFSILEGETTAQGIQKSQILLNTIKDFYSTSLPQISELQTYFGNESIKSLNEQIKNLQNQFHNLNNSLQNDLNVKTSEINQRNVEQQSQIQNLLQNSQTVINDKILEIDKKNTNQQSQIQNFLTKNQDTLNQKFDELNKEIKKAQETVNKVEEVKTNVEKLNQTTQNFSLTSVVSAYGTIFETQSQKNFKFSLFFGVAFLIAIILTIFIVLLWFLPLIKEFNEPTNLKGIEYYILAFSIRLTVLFFVCWIIKELLRNYNSNFHLYNLNKHRSNSLKSFEIIVRNNTLPENRDDVVKQIAQTIFGNQEDGFLSPDKKDIPFSEIVNLVNALKK